MISVGLSRQERQARSEALGLRDSQMRVSGVKLIHNAGWYNADGVKLGFGDLSAADLVQVAAALPEGTAFVALPERASYWDFAAPNESGLQFSPREAAPGRDYVTEHAVVAVLPGRVLWTLRDGQSLDEAPTPRGDYGTTSVSYVARDELRQMLDTAAPAVTGEDNTPSPR